MGNHFASTESLSALIENNDLVSAVKLLQQGADPNELNSSGKSCLRLALEQGHSQLFKIFFQTGGLIIPPLTDESALHYAVRHSFNKLVRLFLRNPQMFPSCKNLKNSQGKTPLHLAAEMGNAELVAILLKYNCDKDAKDNAGKTAKDLAFESNSPQLEEILELLGSEELIVNCPNPGKEIESFPHKRRVSSRSTHFSSVGDIDCKTDPLETAMKESRIPVIPSEQIEFGDIINRGSSCIVYTGNWKGTQIAIKQFKLEYSTSPKETKKFIKEIQVLSQTRHPNLMMIMGVVIDKPNLCIISELLPNCSLFQALHRFQQPLNLETRFKIAIQIAQGLVYLHSNSPPIIHRDLKPENCLLDDAMNVKIADFGLARPLSIFTGEEMQTTVCIGTTRFMAPELFDSKKAKKIGVEVDIWAFGCILIELFSNKRPWNHISSANVNCIYYELFNRKPIPIPTCIPQGVKKIVEKSCDYTPENRPTAFQILNELCSTRDICITVHKKSTQYGN